LGGSFNGYGPPFFLALIPIALIEVVYHDTSTYGEIKWDIDPISEYFAT